MAGTWPPDPPVLSSLPLSPAAAALLVAGLSVLLALLEAALTGLSRRIGAAPAAHWTAHLGGAGDPVRMRRAGAVLRVFLLAAIVLVAVTFGARGLALPGIVAVVSLSFLHLVEQQGRLRLFGARAPWLAAASAVLLKPLARLMPTARGEGETNDGTIAGALEDMADLLATAPEDRRQMVQALLSLEQSTVEDIMVPRSDVIGVDFRSDWDEIVDLYGERIYNLERYYNNLAGFGAGSDTLPERFTKEPSTLAGSKGHVSELAPMLEEYYAARGWEKGVVPEAKLHALGIL